MKIIIRIILTLSVISFLLSSCKTENADNAVINDAIKARYGSEVNVHEGAKEYDNISGDLGHNKELTESITD